MITFVFKNLNNEIQETRSNLYRLLNYLITYYKDIDVEMLYATDYDKIGNPIYVKLKNENRLVIDYFCLFIKTYSDAVFELCTDNTNVEDILNRYLEW